MPHFEYQDQTPSNLRPIQVNKQEFRQPKPKSPDEVGAIWINESSSGAEYLSMKLNLDGKEYNIKGFLFSGKQSKEDKKPDYIAFLSKGIIKERNGNK